MAGSSIWMSADAGGFQIQHLVADGEGDLPRRLAARLVVAHKAPLQDGDRAR